MEPATPNLQRSTPDLTLDPNPDKWSKEKWRTSSGSRLQHKMNSSVAKPNSCSSGVESHGSVRRTREPSVVGELLSSPIRRSRTVSPHHNRSLSFRTMRRPTPHQQVTSDGHDSDEFRSRGATMPSDSASYYLARRRIRSRLRGEQKNPNPSPPIHEPGDDEDDEYYLLRIFDINSKGGIINRGDYIRQKSKSSNSMSSVGSVGGTAASGASNATSYSSGGQGRGPKCRVAILGFMGVGKTALINQFMTSEYMNTYDTQDEDQEKCVSVLLDGIEYELLFVDNPLPVESTEGDLVVEESDAYVVVYSVTERRSFEKAVDILFGMREKGISSKKAVILVGNKSDLARSRELATEEGKSIASSYECKFIETSAVINHNVDELLVGIVSQIRLKMKQKLDLQNAPPASAGSPFRKWGSTKATLRSSLRAKGIINKILGKSVKRSKSCENLHVL